MIHMIYVNRMVHYGTLVHMARMAHMTHMANIHQTLTKLLQTWALNLQSLAAINIVNFM